MNRRVDYSVLSVLVPSNEGVRLAERLTITVMSLIVGNRTQLNRTFQVNTDLNVAVVAKVSK